MIYFKIILVFINLKIYKNELFTSESSQSCKNWTPVGHLSLPPLPNHQPQTWLPTMASLEAHTNIAGGEGLSAPGQSRRTSQFDNMSVTNISQSVSINILMMAVVWWMILIVNNFELFNKLSFEKYKKLHVSLASIICLKSPLCYLFLAFCTIFKRNHLAKRQGWVNVMNDFWNNQNRRKWSFEMIFKWDRQFSFLTWKAYV